MGKRHFYITNHLYLGKWLGSVSITSRIDGDTKPKITEPPTPWTGMDKLFVIGLFSWIVYPIGLLIFGFCGLGNSLGHNSAFFSFSMISCCIAVGWMLLFIFLPSELREWLSKRTRKLSAAACFGLVWGGILLYSIAGFAVIRHYSCQFPYEMCWEDRDGGKYCYRHYCRHNRGSENQCRNLLSERKLSGEFTYYCDEHLCADPDCEWEKEEDGEYCSGHTCCVKGCYNRRAEYKYTTIYGEDYSIKSKYCDEHTCKDVNCYEVAELGDYCEYHEKHKR